MKISADSPCSCLWSLNLGLSKMTLYLLTKCSSTSTSELTENLSTLLFSLDVTWHHLKRLIHFGHSLPSAQSNLSKALTWKYLSVRWCFMCKHKTNTSNNFILYLVNSNKIPDVRKARNVFVKSCCYTTGGCRYTTGSTQVPWVSSALGGSSAPCTSVAPSTAWSAIAPWSSSFAQASQAPGSTLEAF